MKRGISVPVIRTAQLAELLRICSEREHLKIRRVERSGSLLIVRLSGRWTATRQTIVLAGAGALECWASEPEFERPDVPVSGFRTGR